MSRGWNGIFLIVTNAACSLNNRAVRRGKSCNLLDCSNVNPFALVNAKRMSLICALVAPAEQATVQVQHNDEERAVPTGLASCYTGRLGYN